MTDPHDKHDETEAELKAMAWEDAKLMAREESDVVKIVGDYLRHVQSIASCASSRDLPSIRERLLVTLRMVNEYEIHRRLYDPQLFGVKP